MTHFKQTSMFSGLIVFLLLTISCNKDDDNILAPLYTQNDQQKEIIQNISTSIGTGFNDLFTTWYTDSLEQAAFCQNFTHAARFMDDNSGYIFVESFAGYNIAHPAQPQLEGTLTIGQTDAHGKEIVVEMIDIAKYTGFGFLEYEYLNPTTQMNNTKTTFIKSIPEASWYAGSGFYQNNNEPYLSQQQINEEIVRQAVICFSKGLGAIFIQQVSDSTQGVELMRTLLKHIRFFDDQSGYFYVIDFSGYNVVQPPDPSIQGTYEWDIQDSRGNYLVQGLIETAQNGGGFYSYYWEDYQTQEEKLKTAFVMQIPGKDYLIGSGIYLQD